MSLAYLFDTKNPFNPLYTCFLVPIRAREFYYSLYLRAFNLFVTTVPVEIRDEAVKERDAETMLVTESDVVN